MLPQKDCWNNLLYYVDLEALPNGIEGKLPLVPVVEKFEYDYEVCSISSLQAFYRSFLKSFISLPFQYITNVGSRFIFRTNRNYTNYSLIEIDFNKPEEKNWKYLIEGHKTNVLEWASCINQKLVVGYIEDVKTLMLLQNLTTGEVLYKFPLEIGSVVGLSGKENQTEMFFKFSSMITPGDIYRVDLTDSQPIPKVEQQSSNPWLDFLKNSP